MWSTIAATLRPATTPASRAPKSATARALGGDGRLAGDVDAAGEVLGERGDHVGVDVERVEARVGDLVDERAGKLVERRHRATTVDGSVCGAGENSTSITPSTMRASK